MTTRPVSVILDSQHPEGYWESPESFYTRKYRATVWQLIILAELGADPNDPRIRNACRFILARSQDPQSGGFSIRSTASGGSHATVIPCLTGNMLWALLRFGFMDSPQIQQAIDWITTYQRFDDATPDPPTGWPYDEWEMCWGAHTCHMGVVKTLKALAQIPPDRRSPVVRATIKRAAEFMLIHHIHKRSHNLHRVSKPGWKHFSFPLMYQTDVLEILLILTSLGYDDPRMAEAVQLLASKQDPRGRWIGNAAFNDRFLVPVERKGKSHASKWITLRALTVLARLASNPQPSPALSA